MSQWFITRASGNIADHNIIYHLITDLTETPSVWPRKQYRTLPCIPLKEMFCDTTVWENLIDSSPENLFNQL